MRSVGEVLGERYVVHELLGRGGMADVFRATDTETGRDVAVKVMRSIEPGAASRFSTEARVLSLIDHPGVVKLHGSGTHQGDPYLVLDLAAGRSLARLLHDGPMPVDAAVQVAEVVARALAHAHRLGIVHRDVKPSNVLTDDAGNVRLADFGIARLAGTSSPTRTGQVVGSGPYLSPEQVTGEPAGPETDVYALGLVVLECVSGRPSYPGGEIEAAIARLHRPPDIPAGLPRWLRDVLAAMTARDPDRRPSADEVAEALHRRSAEAILASTAPHDVEAILASTAPHDTEAIPASTAPHDVEAPTGHATAPLSGVPDVARSIAMPGDDPDPARAGPTPRGDDTALLPPGLAPLDRGGRRFTVPKLLAAAMLALIAIAPVAWFVGRDAATGPGRAVPGRSADTTVPSTVPPPTTVVTTTPPASATGDGPPAEPSPANDRGGGQGNGQRNGQGHGKGG